MLSIKNSVILLAGVGASTGLSIRAGLGNPISGLGVSDACQTALVSIAESQEASSCLNVPGLAAIITLQANFSAAPAVNTWLQGVCRADPCSDDTINAITSNITTGCMDDFAKENVPQNILQTIMQDAPKFYPTVRNIACLKSTSNDTLCATSTLLNIQQYIGTAFTPDVIPRIVSTGLPANVVCTGCVLAAFDTFKADEAMLAANPTVQSTFSQQCGSEFLSASQPTDVVEGTGSAAPTGTISHNLSSENSALSLTSGISVGLTALSMVIASFTLID